MEAEVPEIPYRRSVIPGARGFAEDHRSCLYVIHRFENPERQERCMRCGGLAVVTDPDNKTIHVYAVEDITDKDAITEIRYSCAMCTHHARQEFRLCALCSSVYHLSGSDRKTTIWHRMLEPHVDECPLKRTKMSKNAKNKAVV